MKRNHEHQERSITTQRHYAGDTTFDGNARAVLGDVSQDVNVAGDVHVHFHAPFQALAVAGSITRFLHFCEQLRLVGRELIKNAKTEGFDVHLCKNRAINSIRANQRAINQPFVAVQQEDQLKSWIKQSNDFRGVLTLLRSEEAKWQIHGGGNQAEQALQELVALSLDDAQKLQSTIRPLTDELLDRLYNTQNASPTVDVTKKSEFVLHALAKLAKTTRIAVKRETRTVEQEFESKNLQLRTASDELNALHRHVGDLVEEELLEVVQFAKTSLESTVLRKSNLSSAYSMFTSCWERQKMDQGLSKMLLYQDPLHLRLDAALNHRAPDALQQPLPSDGELNILSNTDPVQNDIVEILSINRAAQKGLMNVAAILTRRNGDIEAIQPHTNINGSPHDFADTGLIRYDLRKNIKSEEPVTTPLVQQTPEFVRKITTALYFREEGERRVQVKEAHCKTFSWIFEESDSATASQFPKWLRSGDQMFFINGKPGSGKSTLMKYIYQHTRLQELLKEWTRGRTLIFGTFFFWYAGKPLQKSYEGVLRSLLYQILTKRPDLTPRIFPHLSHYILSAPDAQLTEISISELQGAMLLLTKEMPNDVAIFLMVDGVDEYIGDQFEFAKFLEELAGCAAIKILASSRPTSTSFQILNRFPNIRVQDLTAEDIKAYINTELVQTDLMQDRDSLEYGLAQKMKRTLLEKSSGVFLWIVIVVKKLLLGLDASEDTHDLMKIIDELPTELDQLYDLIFGRMSKAHQREGSLLLQLVHHARETQMASSTALQLLEAIKGYRNIGITRTAVAYDQKQEYTRVKMLDGKLRSRCCGLVEVIYKSTEGSLEEPRVDFLHRTVYDYLRQEDVQRRLRIMYDLKPRETNLNLLASSLHMLKRRAFCPLPSITAQACMKDYFAACLIYSEALGLINDHAFLPFLAVADSSYIECCKGIDDAQSIQLYGDAYQMYATARGYADPCVATVILQEADLHTYAVLLSAQLAPPSYFESKVKADPSTKSLLLLHLLDLSRAVRCPSEAFARRYFQNVTSLAQSGVDPNLPAAYVDDTDGCDDDYSRARDLSNGGFITPWNFWLIVYSLNLYHLQITLLLLEAGADLFRPNLNGSLATCLQGMRKKLEAFLEVDDEQSDESDSFHDGRNQSVSERIDCPQRQQRRDDMVMLCMQILKILGSEGNSKSGKRRKNSYSVDDYRRSKKHLFTR